MGAPVKIKKKCVLVSKRKKYLVDAENHFGTKIESNFMKSKQIEAIDCQ